MSKLSKREAARYEVALDSKTKGLISVIDKRADLASMRAFFLKHRCEMRDILHREDAQFWHMHFAKEPDIERSLPKFDVKLKNRHVPHLENIPHRHDKVTLFYGADVEIGISLQGRRALVDAVLRHAEGHPQSNHTRDKIP